MFRPLGLRSRSLVRSRIRRLRRRNVGSNPAGSNPNTARNLPTVYLRVPYGRPVTCPEGTPNFIRRRRVWSKMITAGKLRIQDIFIGRFVVRFGGDAKIYVAKVGNRSPRRASEWRVTHQQRGGE